MEKILHFKDSQIDLNITPNLKFSSKSKFEIIDENISFSNKFELNPDEKDKFLPIMHWTPKIRKNLLVHVLLFLHKNVVQNLFQKQFLKFLNLSFVE